MKKILFILMIVIASSVNAQAQETKNTPEEAAKADFIELSNHLDMDNDAMLQNFHKLFLKKRKDLAKPNLSETDKQNIYKEVDSKIKSLLSQGQLDNILAVDGLYEKLLK